MKNSIVTITGPSCAGKSTLERMLRDQYGYANVISTTTRPQRAGEVNGVGYYFVSRSEFEQGEVDGLYIESIEFNGHKYGVSTAEATRVFAKGQPVVVVVEPGGHRQIVAYAEKHDWNLSSVFVGNPAAVIAERFLRRFTEDDGADLKTYSARLAVMMTEEIDWQIEASVNEELYDLKAWRFDEENCQDVAEIIALYVNRGAEVAA